MKKLKLKLDGKMLSKEQMKKVIGGYGYDDNPFCDFMSVYYSEENCCLSTGWSFVTCTDSETGRTGTYCSHVPADILCWQMGFNH